MNKLEQATLLFLLVGIPSLAGIENLEDRLSLNNNPNKVFKKENLGRASEKKPSFDSYLNQIFQTENNQDSKFRTPSQVAADLIIELDLTTYEKTGTGIYAGRIVDPKRPIKLSDKHIFVDCVDAFKIVLAAEMPKEVNKIILNSRDQDGNFSAPFTLEYLVKNKGWEAYGFYGENEKLKNGVINAPDLTIGKDFYKSGKVHFFLKGLFPRTQADFLLKNLTLERGYGLGIQRDGTHCYTLIQGGLFEIHLNTLPLGYESKDPTPLDLHKGRYYPYSSIAVFAFPPKK